MMRSPGLPGVAGIPGSSRRNGPYHARGSRGRPRTSTCPVTTWVPVTTGVATEAATHLQGTVTYTSGKNIKSSIFWLKVSSPGFGYYCGTFGTTVDCYPTLTLQPDTTKTNVNYSGAQLDGTPVNNNPASEQGDVRWTLTYPQ